MPPAKVAPMPLTDTEIRNTKTGPKPLWMFDAQGLCLELAASGGTWWRLKYRFVGKEKAPPARTSQGPIPQPEQRVVGIGPFRLPCRGCDARRAPTSTA